MFITYQTGSLGNHVKFSFDFAAKICHIYITYLSKEGLEKIRMSNYNSSLRHAMFTTYNLFSRSTFNKKKTVLLFASPTAWVSLDLNHWVVYRKKAWSYKIEQRSQFCLSFPDRSEITRQDTPAKYMFVFVSVGKLLRSYDDQKWTLPNITLEFEIKCSPCTSRNASHWVVCCFESLQRSKRGEWLLDKSLNSI